MKNLVEWEACDKEEMDEVTDWMDQWRDEVTIDINQLNIKVEMILKRLRVLVPLAQPRVMTPKPVEEGPR